MLASKLTLALSKIDKVRKKTGKDPGGDPKACGVKKWKYVLLKDSLDKAIQDLKAWQKMFDPSWFLMKVSSTVIDKELARDSSTGVGSLSTASGLRDALKDDP